MENKDVIFGINGPVVTVKNSRTFSMMEMVYVGKERLVGEVIKITDKATTIQVYEETTGLKPGDEVVGTGAPMNVTLGPGIMDNIFDGIERPLKEIEAITKGAFISRGAAVSPLDENKKWDVHITVKKGDKVTGGDIYATLPETRIIEHKVMVPPNLSGEIVKVNKDGKYSINETVAVLKDSEGKTHDLTLCQKWPIRTPRPVRQKLPADVPLITGQRVIDTLLPISKGGTAAVPGGFGAGKTMTQHQLAKWCDADIIVYVGCGERDTVGELGDSITDIGEVIIVHLAIVVDILEERITSSGINLVELEATVVIDRIALLEISNGVSMEVATSQTSQ